MPFINASVLGSTQLPPIVVIISISQGRILRHHAKGKEKRKKKKEINHTTEFIKKEREREKRKKAKTPSHKKIFYSQSNGDSAEIIACVLPNHKNKIEIEKKKINKFGNENKMEIKSTSQRHISCGGGTIGIFPKVNSADWKAASSS